MFSWAKVLAGAIKFLNALIDYVKAKELIAQGKLQEKAERDAEELKRVTEASRARDDLRVNDGMQPEDLSRLPGKDPFDRDNQ